MTGKWPEGPNNNVDTITQEEKRWNLSINGGYDGLDVSQKKAFDTLQFDKKWKWEKYNEADCSKAISNTVDGWIKKNNLQSPEKEEAELIQQKLQKSLEWKDIKWMIETFAQFRTQLISAMAIDSAKDWKGAKDFSDAQRREKREQDKTQESFLDLWKRLAEQFKSAQEKAQKQLKDWIQASNGAKKDWDIEAWKSRKSAKESVDLWWPT